jgi:predicted unusual protein kinase regulating ubiquinone biosynthesis (AarF/ABC1/UbiB family)
VSSIQAGQHLASMNHVLPREYTDTLTVLQDQARACLNGRMVEVVAVC